MVNAQIESSDDECARPIRHRRYLVTLFSDLSHSTRLLAAMESEEYAELLVELRGAYDEVLTKYGGMIFRVVGDGLLACFGYQVSREDDARRAVEAALELHDLVKRRRWLGLMLKLHSGIHAGLVLVEPGDAVSGRMVLVGNSVNIAARLADAADDDEILVSKETLGADQHFFQTDGGRLLELHGIERPIAAWKILARAPIGCRFETRVRRGLTTFVGRQLEMDTLGSRLAQTIAGASQYLAVVAPAGQGKTRLAEEFLSRVDRTQVHVLRGYCESYLSAAPLQPFLQMLRTVLGVTDNMTPDRATAAAHEALAKMSPTLLDHEPMLLSALSLLPEPPAVDGADPQRSTGRRARAFFAVFDALAAQRPLLIFIDDWQWADDGTRQLLAGIRALPDRSIFAFVAARQSTHERIGLAGAGIMSLKPFANVEADEMIKHLLEAVNTFEIARIREVAGGNPLFLEELCHSVSQGAPHADKPKGQYGTAWLSKLIEARIERLAPAQKNLIRMAAVIGNIVPLRVLEVLSGCHAGHPMLDELAELDLLYRDADPNMLRFKHGIARDVIYETVGLHERRALHLRIVEILQQQVSVEGSEGIYEQLGYHFGAARHFAEAARYSELAGDKAIANSALDRAQVQYQAALEALSRNDLTHETYRTWLAIARRLGLVCVFDPSVEQLRLLCRAVDIAARFDDEAARGHAEYWVGYVHYGLGDFKRATQYLERALDRGRRLGDAPLAKWCGATLGQACAAAGQYPRALSLLRYAVAEKRSQARMTRPAVGYAYSLACEASVLGDQGNFDAAQEKFREALESVAGAGHEVEGSILCWQSAVFSWQGRWEEALEAAQRAQRIAERVKSLYLYSMGRALGGYARWKTAATADALQTILESTTWLERDGKRLFISLNYGWIAEILVAGGQLHAARQYAARAFGRARMHDRLGSAMACRALARAAHSGRYSRTPAHYLGMADRYAAMRQSKHEAALNASCRAELLLADNRISDAHALFEETAHDFTALGMRWHATRAARRLGS